MAPKKIVKEEIAAQIPEESGAACEEFDIGSEVARLVALVVGLGVESALLGVRKSRPSVMRLIDDQLSTLEA